MARYLVTIELAHPAAADLAVIASRDLYGYEPEVRPAAIDRERAEIALILSADDIPEVVRTAVGLIDVHRLGRPFAVQVVPAGRRPL